MIKDIDNQKLKQAARVIRAVKHPLRLKLMEFIDQNEPVQVTKIYKTLGLEQSVTSQHLAILREGGFVKTKREGKRIFYSVNVPRVEQVLKLIDQYC